MRGGVAAESAVLSQHAAEGVRLVEVHAPGGHGSNAHRCSAGGLRLRLYFLSIFNFQLYVYTMTQMVNLGHPSYL
eukprot:1194721-Prorocentrum_minimum.AAC.2